VSAAVARDVEEAKHAARIATGIAKLAGELLLTYFRKADLSSDLKSDYSIVTEADVAADHLIAAAIATHFPGDGILSEELAPTSAAASVDAKPHTWVVDPLDGTTNYLYRHAGFAVSIAAEHDGEVVAGVVHDPLHGEVFTATRGGGARRNGVAVSASSEDRLGHALVATGFGYDPERRARQAAVLARIIPSIRDIRRMGAAAVDLCSVACGRVDAYYERGLHVWDHAAGGLIAAEAGAWVGGLLSPEIGDGVCIAAPPALLEPLRALLVDAGAADV
jgi:myo-inositol-1(or 4)-monophosphatase